MPTSRIRARPVPPTVYHPTLGRAGYARLSLDAVVVIVRVAVPAEAPLILTGLVEPKLNMGRS
jgi:hypothetical protein